VLKHITLITVIVLLAALVISFITVIAVTTGSHSVHWTRHGAVSTTTVSPWVIWPLAITVISAVVLTGLWWRSRHS
jgi:cell shape-determining protein MreD